MTPPSIVVKRARVVVEEKGVFIVSQNALRCPVALLKLPAIVRLTTTIGLFALLGAATPGVADAGIVYEVNTTGATQIGSKNNGGVFIGQSFNSGPNNLLTSATLQINRNALGAGDFTLNLHAVTGSPNAYLKTGSSLAAATFTNSILSETLGDFYEFTNLEWPMSPNTDYMIGIASETDPTVKWTLNQSAAQNSGTGFLTGYSGFNAQAGTNVDNGRHGATIAAVPEPSTYAMALAGLLCGGYSLLRRRKRA